jgi:sporulation protein YlmC with PRC-barrel domain
MKYEDIVLGSGLVLLSTIASVEPGACSENSAAEPAGHPKARLVSSIDDVVGLAIQGAEGKQLGVVEDLVLDSLDGSIDFLVVGEGGVLGIGEEQLLLPYESFKLGPPTGADEELRVTTALGEERVRKAPKLPADLRIGPELERASREAAGLPSMPMQPRAKDSELVGAARVQGVGVLGVTHEKLGRLEDVVIDPRGAVVAYTVLETSPAVGLGGRSVSLAWETTQVKLDAANKVVIDSKLTKESLARAAAESAGEPPVVSAPAARDG